MMRIKYRIATQLFEETVRKLSVNQRSKGENGENVVDEKTILSLSGQPVLIAFWHLRNRDLHETKLRKRVPRSSLWCMG